MISIATSYYGLSVIYRMEGLNINKGFEYAVMDLSICQSIYGVRHPSLASSFNNLAHYHFIKMDYAKALEFIDKDIKILKSRVERASQLNQSLQLKKKILEHLR